MKKLFTILFIFVAAFFKSNAQGLVINEVDYDQPSVDSAEFIELYNSASSAINLGIYRVVLVNGNNNTPYDSIQLPNQLLNAGAYFVICSTYGLTPLCDMTHTTPAAGWIQNGSPDAIAIRDTTTGAIIDAVSYEGNVAPPYIEGNGVPLGQSDTATSPSTLYRYTGISRYPDGADTNDDSTDFHRSCITPGMANDSTTLGCQSPLSVKTLTVKSSGLELYPNPSRGIVNIELNGNQFRYASVSVSDLLGNEIKKVYFKNSDPNCELNLSEFQDGIYFVKVKSDSGEFMKRVILKK